ncbi:MAG: PIN domain-containing protein [Saprospiraceae bacterium]
MSGSKALLDTNVIILLSKQGIDVDALISRYDEFYVSIITYMETYGYDFQNNAEKNIIDAFFELVEVIDVNKSIAQNVIVYKQSKKKKIKLPDAIILATAKYLGADLLSDDWDDFINIDPSVPVLNIDNLKR